MSAVDDDLGAPSAEEMIDLLQEEVEILTGQLDALSSGHRGDLLAAEIRARFGIKRRLDQELARVKDLEKERNHYKTELLRQRTLVRELVALVEAPSEHDLLERVRKLVRGV
jgi:hypothetical protein